MTPGALANYADRSAVAGKRAGEDLTREQRAQLGIKDFRLAATRQPILGRLQCCGTGSLAKSGSYFASARDGWNTLKRHSHPFCRLRKQVRSSCVLAPRVLPQIQARYGPAGNMSGPWDA